MFELVVKHRLKVITSACAVTLFLGVQLPGLRLDPDTEAYVPKGHPIRMFWNEAKERFGMGRDILVAIEAEGDDGIFTPAMLERLTELTAAIEELDGVVAADVTSLSGAEAMRGTEEGLDVEPFFDEPPATARAAADVRRAVFDNTVYIDRLVSRDAAIAAIIVRTHHSPDAMPTEIYRRIRELAEGFEIPGGRILIAGNPAVEYVYGRQMAADLSNLIPAALMAVLVVLFLCFRTLGVVKLTVRAGIAALLLWASTWASGAAWSWGLLGGLALSLSMLTVRGVLLPVLVVVASVVWTWGFQALLGMPIYIAGTLVPPLLLAIGCADGIHIMERYYERAADSRDRDAVVLATMREMWRPVVLTSITTAAGFGSLMVGRMTVYQVFGLTTAFGILAAMVISLTVLPAALALLPLPAAPATGHGHGVIPRSLMALGRGLERRRRAVLATGLVVTALLAFAARGLVVDYSWVESLQLGTPVLEAERVLRTRHGGTMPLDVIVRSPQPDGIKDPVLLRAIDRTLEEIARHPYVGDTRSIAEYIKRMNQAMNEDRPEAFRIPDSRDLVAQYLLLYSMSGDPTEFDDVVDYDYQAARLSVLLRTDRMVIMDSIIAEMERLLDEHVRPLGATATATGSAVIQKTVLDMILVSQVYSLATAAALVFLFLLLLFRSMRDALVCMLPPLVTGVANFGGMAALGIPLGPDKAMISAIALGIGIDYSIHLMSRFRDSVADGMNVYDAIVEAMRTTGRAILFNAIVVIAGFSVLGLSASPSNATFGLMIASNMAVSCLTALLLLPAALTVLGHLHLVRATHASVRIAGLRVNAKTARSLGVADEASL